jgi:hypothetical protein
LKDAKRDKIKEKQKWQIDYLKDLNLKKILDAMPPDDLNVGEHRGTLGIGSPLVRRKFLVRKL